ncbi:unannotated protein [freshwater metagenome]|uniref:Unannotated protein n=1 Tax=freshwater metagenome TaxID=449393 RepID=A0A6J5YCB7_9ZZZZ
MGTRVGTHGEARLDEQRGDHPCGGTLAVRSGDVDHLEGFLRITQHRDKCSHLVEGKSVYVARRRFEIDMTVEEPERFCVVHGDRSISNALNTLLGGRGSRSSALRSGRTRLDSARNQRRVDLLKHNRGVDDDLADVFAAG